MSEVDIIENFYGVYLLYCMNPRFLGRTYIGYTVNPKRRINQHNKGSQFGGAWRTSGRGPWKMVLIIHGFPNDISALRFEWAWQHPLRSRRLKHIARKKVRENAYDYRLRLLSEMLLVGPWNRLPLTIRWLEDEFVRDFPANKIPPVHMPVCYGPVISKKIIKNQENYELEAVVNDCIICYKEIKRGKELRCLSPKCNMTSHIICLAKEFLKDSKNLNFIPIDGSCPKCNLNLLWGDIVRKYNGCYEQLAEDLDDLDSDFDN